MHVNFFLTFPQHFLRGAMVPFPVSSHVQEQPETLSQIDSLIQTLRDPVSHDR